MKNLAKSICILFAGMLVCSHVQARKSAVFADVGIPFSGPGTGASVTYNYQLLKRFSLGAGLQVYRFSPTIRNTDVFTPAIFADLRLSSRLHKKHYTFYFLDLGSNRYDHNDVKKLNNNRTLYSVPHDNGFYTGLGLGYCRMIRKNRSGIYASLKILSNAYGVDRYDIVTKEASKTTYVDATLALSVGFKF